MLLCPWCCVDVWTCPGVEGVGGAGWVQVRPGLYHPHLASCSQLSRRWSWLGLLPHLGLQHLLESRPVPKFSPNGPGRSQEHRPSHRQSWV